MLFEEGEAMFYRPKKKNQTKKHMVSTTVKLETEVRKTVHSMIIKAM